jgi:hypothetical protein
MRADCLGFAEPVRIIDGRLEGHCRHRTDARNGAKASAELVPADHLHQEIVQLFVLGPQRFHALYMQSVTPVISRHKLPTRAPALRMSRAEPAVPPSIRTPSGLSDLVLYVEQFALKRSPVSRQKSNFVTFLALDMNRSIPTRTHQVRQSSRIIFTGLVALSFQRRCSLPCLQQDHGKATGLELTVQPRRDISRFMADFVEPWEVRRQRFKDDRRICRNAGFEHDGAVAAVHDADRGLGARLVECC